MHKKDTELTVRDLDSLLGGTERLYDVRHKRHRVCRGRDTGERHPGVLEYPKREGWEWAGSRGGRGTGTGGVRRGREGEVAEMR